MFRCFLHHLQGTIAFLAQELYAFLNIVVKCTIYPVFQFTMLLKCLKQYVFGPSVSLTFNNNVNLKK